MSVLNSPAYAVEKDKLIYDGTYPVDGGAVPVTITADTDGVIKRGSVIDFDEDSEEYSPHKEGGTPSCIVAEDTEYTAEDTAVVVPIYISGTFRTSAIIAEPELGEAGREALRRVGIHLK